MKKNYYVLMMLFMFIALNQSAYAQIEVTKDFATDPSWTGSGNTENNNEYGYNSTEKAIGGIFSRTATFTYYADTQLNGVLDRTNTFRVKGSLILQNNNMTGNFYLGYFDKDAPNRDKFIGIQIANPDPTAADPFRAFVRAMGAFTPTPIPLSQNTTLNFDLTWTGSSDGSGTVTGTLAGQDVYHPVVSGISTPFNAFGILVGGQNNTFTTTNNCYFDNLTYTKFSATGVDQQSENIFGVYPGVTSDNIYFRNIPENCHVELMNMAGQTLLVKNASEIKHGLSLKAFERGLYLIRLMSGSEYLHSVKVIRK